MAGKTSVKIKELLWKLYKESDKKSVLLELEIIRDEVEMMIECAQSEQDKGD